MSASVFKAMEGVPEEVCHKCENQTHIHYKKWSTIWVTKWITHPLLMRQLQPVLLIVLMTTGTGLAVVARWRNIANVGLRLWSGRVMTTTEGDIFGVQRE